MDLIMLDSVRVIREMCDDLTRDVMYYTSSVYKYAILDAVAQLLNAKYREYREAYPKFTGKVSLFCHALGSVIAFDLVWNQPQAKHAAAGGGGGEGTGAGRAGAQAPSAEEATDGLWADGGVCDPTAGLPQEGGGVAAGGASDCDHEGSVQGRAGCAAPTANAAPRSPGPPEGAAGGARAGAEETEGLGFRGAAPGDKASSARPNSRGGRDTGREGWVWPVLDFEVDNIFALGSPIAMFCTVRGDILHPTWPRGSTDFALPGGTRLFNLFHPTDPFAYRLPQTCSICMHACTCASPRSTSSTRPTPLPIGLRRSAPWAAKASPRSLISN